MWWPEMDCIFQVGSDKGFIEWEHEFCALVVKFRAMNISTLLAVLQLFSVCFCHLRSLFIVIPRSRCSSVAVSCGSPLCSYVDCCCDQCAAHLSMLKFIYQAFTQSTSLLRSSCNSRTSSRFLELWQNFVSSANLDILLTMPLSWL